MHTLIDQVPSAATVAVDVEALRRSGHQVVDWVVESLAGTVNALPLAQARLAQVGDSQGDMQCGVSSGISQAKLSGLDECFTLPVSVSGILDDMSDVAFNAACMLWRTSLTARDLEQQALEWLRQGLGLTDAFQGMFQPHSSVLHALVAAREALPNLHIQQKGLAGRRNLPRLRFYASQEAHASIEKAAMIMGIGQEGLRKVETDESYRMDAGALERAIQEDLRAGWLPFAVVATVGTPAVGSVDPVAKIADLCDLYRLWLHVDASSAGLVAMVPQKNWLLKGWERAASLTISPHEGLFSSLGESVFFTCKPELVNAALSLTQTTQKHTGGTHDELLSMLDDDGSPLLSLSAAKLWMVIHCFGQEWLVERLSAVCQLAHFLARAITTTADFVLLSPVPLCIICFRAHPEDMQDEVELEALNQRILRRVNDTGHAALTHTWLRATFTLRIVLNAGQEQEAYMYDLWEEIQSAMQIEITAVRRHKKNSQHLNMLSLPSRVL